MRQTLSASQHNQKGDNENIVPHRAFKQQQSPNRLGALASKLGCPFCVSLQVLARDCRSRGLDRADEVLHN